MRVQNYLNEIIDSCNDQVKEFQQRMKDSEIQLLNINKELKKCNQQLFDIVDVLEKNNTAKIKTVGKSEKIKGVTYRKVLEIVVEISKNEYDKLTL